MMRSRLLFRFVVIVLAVVEAPRLASLCLADVAATRLEKMTMTATPMRPCSSWHATLTGSAKTENVRWLFHRATAIDASNANAWRGLGRVELLNRHYAAANEAFSRSWDLGSHDLLSSLYRGWLADLSGNAGARRASWRSIPDFDEVLTAYGERRLRSGEPREASHCFSYAIDIAPTNGLAWLEQGQALLVLGDARRAVGALDEATRRLSANREELAMGYVYRAEALLKLGDHNAAEASCATAVASGNEYLPRFLCGNIAGACNEKARAKELWAKAIAADSNHPEPFEQIAGAMEDAGDFATAFETCNTLVRRFPAYGRSYACMAHAFYKQGQFDKAVTWYEDARQRDPSDSSTSYWLARSMIELHRTPEARAELERAAMIHPFDPAIRQLLADVRGAH